MSYTEKQLINIKLFNTDHKSFRGLVVFNDQGEIESWDVSNIPRPSQETLALWSTSLQLEKVERELINKEKSIRNKYAGIIEDIAKPYTSAERETWHVQSNEAKEYILDNSINTPLLDELADARGITRLEMANKIKFI